MYTASNEGLWFTATRFTVMPCQLTSLVCVIFLLCDDPAQASLHHTSHFSGSEQLGMLM